MSGSYDNNNACLNRNVCNDIRGLSLNLRTITFANSPYNVQTDDNIILVNATSGQVDVKLLKGNKYPHPIFVIKKLDNSVNKIRVLPGDAGNTIESSNSYFIDQPDEIAQFVYDIDNVDWKLITHDLDMDIDILASKGDLLTNNGLTLDVLNVGLPGQVLSADNATLTGLKWVTLGSHIIEYPLLTTKVAASTMTWTDVAYFPWLDSAYSSYSNGKIILRAIIDNNKNLDVRLYDVTNNTVLGSIIGINTTSSTYFTVNNPVSDAELQLQIQRSAGIGTNPIIVGVILEFSS